MSGKIQLKKVSSNVTNGNRSQHLRIFLLYKIGRVGIDGSKSNVVMNAWLPCKAVISMGMTGYPGLGGYILSALPNAGCRSITIGTNNNDFLVFFG